MDNKLFEIDVAAAENYQSTDELKKMAWTVAEAVCKLAALKKCGRMKLPDGYELCVGSKTGELYIRDTSFSDVDEDPITGEMLYNNDDCVNICYDYKDTALCVAQHFAECVTNGWLDKVRDQLHCQAVKNDEGIRALREELAKFLGVGK